MGKTYRDIITAKINKFHDNSQYKHSHFKSYREYQESKWYQDKLSELNSSLPKGITLDTWSGGYRSTYRRWGKEQKLIHINKAHFYEMRDHEPYNRCRGSKKKHKTTYKMRHEKYADRVLHSYSYKNVSLASKGCIHDFKEELVVVNYTSAEYKWHRTGTGSSKLTRVSENKTTYSLTPREKDYKNVRVYDVCRKCNLIRI